MKRLGILGVCLLAMAAPVAGGAQQPPPSDSQDSSDADQAADPSGEDGTAQAAPAAVAEDAPAHAGVNGAPTGGTPESMDYTPGFDPCRPKGTIGRKYGPVGSYRAVTNAPAGTPETGAFGDVPPAPLPPC
jgi:hypothetical protein